MVALDVTRAARVAGAPAPGRFPGARARADRLQSLGTDLAIAALVVAMFPRILTALGAPALVKFLHFPVTLGAVLLIAPRIRSTSAMRLLGGLYALLCVIFASAFLNGAGVVNALLDFLLLSEPFLLLLLLTNETMPARQLGRLRRAILLIAAIHVGMAYFQFFVMGLRVDDVKGVFLAQGAGHHVGGAVALTTAAYVLASPGVAGQVLRWLPAGLCALVVYFSDAKQVTLVFLISLFLLGLRRRARFRVAVRRVAAACAACGMVFTVAHAFVPSLIGLGIWTDPERVRMGLEQKLSVFPLLVSHHESAANALLGLGPGHTCGRLGELIPDYREQLDPLGVTTSAVTTEVLELRDSHWMSAVATGSSLWSPFFFWSGLFGDLGIAGVASIVFLWGFVWRRHAQDDLARFLLTNVLLFGVVFSWLEEPGYTMFVAAILSMRWQESRRPLERVHRVRGGARLLAPSSVAMP